MKKLFIIAILLVSNWSFSQKHELGKVTIDELKEEVCPSDTSAVAAYLFNVGRTDFVYNEGKGYGLVTEIIAKIKIYKKGGYDLANKSVSFSTENGGTHQEVYFSKAVTYNLVNNAIEKTKLNKDGEFEEVVNRYWSRKKITMPNVKVGSIIEYKIEIRSPYVDVPDWDFQKSIPVNYSEYTTYIPEYFIYNTRSKGFFTPKLETEVTQRAVASYTITKSKYTLENVPALVDESFVNNIDNYRSTILYELSGERFPNRATENYATDWESVAKKIYESEDFGNELKKTGYFEKDLDVLLNEITSTEERIATIFNYVKSRMNWNEFLGIYCNDGVKKAYQDKKGNVAEINLMLTAMLRYAGIQANPVLISTRLNGISIFPSRSAFDYVLAGVELQNKTVLLDATSKYSLPNILPTRDLNWFGRIIRKDGTSEQINLMPTFNSKEAIIIMGNIDDKGVISGKIRDQYFDYNAFSFRVKNNGLKKESYIEKLEKRHQGLEVGEYEVQNSNDLSKPIIENYEFTTNNAVEIIADKMYFSPFLFFAITENPFKQEKREYPVDFSFPTQDKFNISIKIPDGYAVETLPQSKAVAMPDSLANFKYTISNTGNQIQLLYTLDINQAIIGSEDYEILKNFFKEVVNKQTEKIVLKKI